MNSTVDSIDYIKHPEKGFPQTIWWDVVTPKKYRLSVLQEYDLIYDQKDIDIRFPKRNEKLLKDAGLL